jgi:hypothetical protein
MKFVLSLTTDNDAFQPEPALELAVILRKIADQIEAGDRDIHCYQTIFDTNGNDVGRYALKTDEYLKG